MFYIEATLPAPAALRDTEQLLVSADCSRTVSAHPSRDLIFTVIHGMGELLGQVRLWEHCHQLIRAKVGTWPGTWTGPVQNGLDLKTQDLGFCACVSQCVDPVKRIPKFSNRFFFLICILKKILD